MKKIEKDTAPALPASAGGGMAALYLNIEKSVNTELHEARGITQGSVGGVSYNHEGVITTPGEGENNWVAKTEGILSYDFTTDGHKMLPFSEPQSGDYSVTNVQSSEWLEVHFDVD